MSPWNAPARSRGDRHWNGSRSCFDLLGMGDVTGAVGIYYGEPLLPIPRGPFDITAGCLRRTRLWWPASGRVQGGKARTVMLQ